MQAIRRVWVGFVAGLLGTVFSITLSDAIFAAEISNHQGFRLLALDGSNVKWGEPRPGTAAVVRYAFLTAPLARNGATNCRSMEPFPSRFVNGGASSSEVSSEFRAAFSAWERIAGIRFVEASDSRNADLLLGAQVEPKGIAYADIIPERDPSSPFVSIRGAAICFNPAVQWETAFDGNHRTYDVRYVATHEIGHVIGLDHVGGKIKKIMSFKYRELARVPQAGDAAGARLLYGPPFPGTAEIAAELPVANPAQRTATD